MYVFVLLGIVLGEVLHVGFRVVGYSVSLLGAALHVCFHVVGYSVRCSVTCMFSCCWV